MEVGHKEGRLQVDISFKGNEIPDKPVNVAACEGAMEVFATK